jgi:hypothetical protein
MKTNTELKAEIKDIIDNYELDFYILAEIADMLRGKVDESFVKWQIQQRNKLEVVS